MRVNPQPESSRAILATVAGGTIGAISVVFSLTLVAIQLAASQFSPRVIRGILGDQVQQVIVRGWDITKKEEIVGTGRGALPAADQGSVR